MDPIGSLMMGLAILLIILAIAIPAMQRRNQKKEEA